MLNLVIFYLDSVEFHAFRRTLLRVTSFEELSSKFFHVSVLIYIFLFIYLFYFLLLPCKAHI